MANQAVLQARKAVADYYDGWLQSDDELHPLRTRNISLRVQVLLLLLLPLLEVLSHALLLLSCLGLHRSPAHAS